MSLYLWEINKFNVLGKDKISTAKLFFNYRINNPYT
jgi:hypothetical protein